MLVTLSFYSKDQDQTERLARWLIDLGGCKGHELLLGVDSSVEMAQSASILELFTASFDKVTVLPIANPYDSWPSAPNHCFSTVARHIENNKLAPYWFWLEPDCVFIRAGALNPIEAEYKLAQQDKKHFLAAFVSVHTPELDVEDHGSGIGIYPGQMTRHAGLALIAGDLAFDVAAAEQILPQLHKTKLIAHSWKHKPFENWEQVERELLTPHPEAVIWHASKDGSLVDLLRARMNLSGGVERRRAPGSLDGIAQQSERASQEQIVKANPPENGESTRSGSHAPSAQSSFTCDILIKSYPRDYEFLSYCLRAINKFATGFREVVIIVPKGEAHPLDKFGYRIIETVENGDGYLYQQAVKASAHEFTDADYILHIDSDVILTQPITPESFFHEGKPIWYFTPYSAIDAPWQPFTEKFIGEPVEYEWMRRLPMMIPRKLHQALAAFCLVHHKQRLTDYILSQPNREYSEFNALGALAYIRAREDFHWIDTTKVEMPEPFGIQHFSHDGVTPEIRARLEKILADTPAEAASPIRQTKEGIWILTNDTHISKWVEEKGQLQHDFQTLPIVLNEINEGDTVIDVGAFIGDTAAPFLHKVGPQGQVFCFEPHPDAWECLKRNLPMYSNARAFQVALSDDAGELWLATETNAGASHRDKPCNAPGIKVKTATLDSYGLEKCDVIKVDAEGMEISVLKGAEQTIAKFRPKLLIEVNEGALKRQGTSSGELFGWLREHDYEWRPVQDLHIPDPPQYDILCKWKGGDALRTNAIAPLEESTEFTSNIVPRSSNAAPTVQPAGAAITPWANKKESIAYIDQLALELKRFCTAPRSTLVVREELRKIRVITKVR